MRFDGDNLAIVVYVFTSGMDDSERLVEDSHCDGTRERLLSLKPGCELFDNVINMVVGMCTGDKADGRKWWLPTTFSHMILNPHQLSAPIMEYIKQRYMGLADDLMMIYVPMHIGNHWYLMIVGSHQRQNHEVVYETHKADNILLAGGLGCYIWEKKLVYLDSCKSTEEVETASRISQMKEVARYIGVLIRSRSFWDNKDGFPPLISEFEPEKAQTGQQAPGS
ncbi:hypothetical protein PIB30_040102 [Stylosanthes scabra]|uniref:Ubiquitin-like protease family profile domain-containing protein n=1 Tax=Stylosanthes scabra TaxID=79078 RepID=A0ABU6QE42_9FABA|nr:hypothetical protein [Stylosanthes scabra]